VVSLISDFQKIIAGFKEKFVRKIVVSEYITLDGVFENPAWTWPYWSLEIAKFKFDELFGSDALLLGRVTYEGFAKAWPDMKDEQGYADRMNGLPKYVVTSTLENGTWNNSNLLKNNFIEEITRLKQEEGQDILVFGSADLAQTLLENGLVDQYNLVVYPVVVGTGKRFFKEGATANLKLVETKTFDTGVVAFIYQPAPKTPEEAK
jgi:dihydrofolate reductase